MLDLFQLLKIENYSGLKGVPVFDGCDWTVDEPEITGSDIKACFNIENPFTSLTLDIQGLDIIDGLTFDIDPATIDSTINSSWLAPMLSIGNKDHNLSGLLLNTSIYWSMSSLEQQSQGEAVHVIGNKGVINISAYDGMRFFLDNEITSPTYGSLVIGLPFQFITTPLGEHSQYDHNYWIQQNPDNTNPVPVFEGHYNPRRYVLTWYTTTVNPTDVYSTTGYGRNCGTAVWSEPQCCMQTLVLDSCMLGLGGGDSCNGRCQTIRDSINGTEWVNICNVFNQQISINGNDLCYQIPGATQSDPYIDLCVDLSETNNHYLVSHPGTTNYALELFNSANNVLSSAWLEFMNNQTLSIVGNNISISQPSGAIQTISLSETNNHTLNSYYGSTSLSGELEILNSNGEVIDSVYLDHINNQTLIYDSVPVTNIPHPAPATVNNTVCITHPSPNAPQCVDLNKVNNQEIYRSGSNLIINSIEDPQNDCDSFCSGRVLDMIEYIKQRDCSNVCNCVMDSVPVWNISTPSGGFNAAWSAFLAGNPSVFSMLSWLTNRIQMINNQLFYNNISLEYNRPCNLSTDNMGATEFEETDIDGCDPCCKPNCGGGSGLVVQNFTNVNVTLVNNINDRKHNGKRWLLSDWEVTQSFNGVLDSNGDICEATNHNIGWFQAGSSFGGAYGWNPSSMANSQMTTPFDSFSGIKVLKDGSYTVYMDGPIKVNHMVHGYRISLILIRGFGTPGEQRIMIQDFKKAGDVQSGSGSVNNGYFKESKYDYVSSKKVLELLRGDIITIQVKIDANVSRPHDELDPITLGEPGKDVTLWSDQSYGDSAASANWVYRATGGTHWDTTASGFGINNEGVRIEYGGPTSVYNQNFNMLSGGTPASGHVYQWLNGFVRTATKALTLSHTNNHSGCFSVNCSPHASHDASHSHAVVARFPAIAPQAPKYIHFSSSSSADWNYPGRYTPAHLNPNSLHTINDQYSNTGIDTEGSVILMAKSGIDESACPAQAGYDFISDQSGFSFGFNLVRGERPNQVEIYP